MTWRSPLRLTCGSDSDCDTWTMTQCLTSPLPNVCCTKLSKRFAQLLLAVTDPRSRTRKIYNTSVTPEPQQVSLRPSQSWSVPGASPPLTRRVPLLPGSFPSPRLWPGGCHGSGKLCDIWSLANIVTVCGASVAMSEDHWWSWLAVVFQPAEWLSNENWKIQPPTPARWSGRGIFRAADSENSAENDSWALINSEATEALSSLARLHTLTSETCITVT